MGLRVVVTLEQCWHAVPGGTAAAALSSVEALRRLPDAPELLGVSAWHRHPPSPPYAPGIPVAQLRLPRTALYAAWHRARRMRVQRATGSANVIHATGMAVPPRSAPLAVTVNDLAFLHHPDHATRRGQRFFLRSLELTRRDADIVICPSQQTADDCTRVGLDAERLRVVPYHTPGDLVSETQAQAVRQRFDLPDRYVLWVGTLEPRKNLGTLLKAWHLLGRREEQLVLVGPEGWGPNLAGELAAAPGVRRLGFVGEADKRALLRAAAVVCLPSLLEGFGLPVLEAMTQAVPVVTARGGATEEVAGAAGVLVDPTEAGQIAEAMAGLLDDPAEASRRGECGRRRALQEFTWQRTAEGLHAVYRELAGR